MVKQTDTAHRLLREIKLLEGLAGACEDLIDPQRCAERIDRMLSVLHLMHPLILALTEEEPAMAANEFYENILAILEAPMTARIAQYALLPLIQELYVDIRFWGMCYPDQEKMHAFYRGEMNTLCPLPGEGTGALPYELSIVVLAYNKLEYTQKCVESLIRNLPEDIHYELILVNNGSSDGTKAYFERQNPDKLINLKINVKSFGMISRVIEGKYTLFVSNDIIVTPNAIANMLTCIRSGERIGCVTATCPNSANYQSIRPCCTDLSKLDDFARANNISDPLRWEQRVRLVMPMMLTPSHVEGVHAFFGYRYPYSPSRFLAFTDDLMSMLLRREGWKLILAKDAYVHHHGSITIKSGPPQTNLYTQVRQEFINTFLVDPWWNGAWYEPGLTSCVRNDHRPEENVSILSVNCGFGSNPLKIKDTLREQGHDKTTIYGVTTKSEYLPDLNAIADFAQCEPDLVKTAALFQPEQFDYIVLEDKFKLDQDVFLTLNHLRTRLKPAGVLALHGCPPVWKKALNMMYPGCETSLEWIVLRRADVALGERGKVQ